MAASQVETTGYAELWIVSLRQDVEIKVLSTEAVYSHRVVRLIQVQDDPYALPVQEEEITGIAIEKHVDGKYQSGKIGSYRLVDQWANIKFGFGEGLEVEFYFQPYLLDAGRLQTIVSTLDAKIQSGVAVILDKDSPIQLYIGTESKIKVIKSAFKRRQWRWIKISR